MSPATELDDAPTVIAPGDPLLEGTRLRDYEITGLLHEGGFSIVYRAWDQALQRHVSLKEYLPASMASRDDDGKTVAIRSAHHVDTFAIGLRSFLDEARLLARFDHASLVKVYRFWEDNGTAYMAMPFYEGPLLERALADLGRVPGEAELRAWLKPVLNAVTVLHEAGVWHQNIGPDEIVLTPTGPVLLGLASAGHAIEAVQRAPAAALKRGYAAIEQYGGVAGAALGPWTDLYALAAVVHAAITGAPPPPAPDRLVNDGQQPLAQIAAGLYSAGFLAAVDAALALQPASRPADHLQFRALMGDIDAPAPPVSLAPRLDLMQEPFLAKASSHREITVPDRPFLVPTRPDPPPPDPGAADQQATHAADAGKPPVGMGTKPSWMEAGAVPASARRPIPLWAVALVGAVVLAALAWQLLLRPARLLPPPSSTAAASAPVAQTGRPATIAPQPSAPAPAVISAPLPSPGVAATAGSLVPLLPVPSAPASRLAASEALGPRPTPGSAAPPTAAELQARCTDILQKASLEAISAADTEFFKKACK